MKPSTITILGAGSWGTAVAIHLAHSGHEVLLWGNEPDAIAEMAKKRSNDRYLPGITFPETLHPKSDLVDCIDQSDEVIIAVPSHAFSEVLAQIPEPLPTLSWLTKGIDPVNQQLLSQIVFEQWGEIPIAVISGPSFAKEVARYLPTALVVAGQDDTHLDNMQNIFHHRNIRVYKSHDPVGVQVSGAVKNILAIACGISDGLHYGANAKAALITRGLAEMSRLGASLGAEHDTFMGLTGLGDLVLTCTDDQSRNRRFGLNLGQSMAIDEAEKVIGQVVEGRHNAAQVAALAAKHHVDMPISREVNAIIQGKITVKQAVENLMARPPKAE